MELIERQSKNNIYKYKWESIEILIDYYFGKILKGDKNIKIISIGDSRSYEFDGAKVAFDKFIERQPKKVLNKINISLHRVKFAMKPSWKQLTEELNYMTTNMEYIVKHNHISTDYIARKKGESILWKTKQY